VRGFRIELGEIEAVLSEHPGVRKSVVLSREDKPGEKRLVAYVVSKQLPGPTIDELRSFLREKVPDHMVPSAFVMLDELPLTRIGKVDRGALPKPERTRPELEGTLVAPRTEAEETLASIWCEVLDLKEVGLYDNFFELGGHSLLATQVISRVRRAFQVQLPLRALFAAPTIAGLSNAVEKARAGVTERREVALEPISREAHRAKLSSLRRIPKARRKE